MSEENTYGYIGDSQEQIDKCLNCWRAECINCLGKSQALQDEQPLTEEEQKQTLEDDVLQLWKAGMNDTQIGKIVDRSSSNIGDIRKKLGLPCNAKNGRQFKFNYTTFDEEMFYKLYYEGRSDRYIARMMDVPKNRVDYFRKKQGLPSNFKGRARVRK